ncbi:MAG: M48 family metalloprotease [Myxococcales bacterium]|nr:M48 family metalloprotease [Myxococcales bacterium]
MTTRDLSAVFPPSPVSVPPGLTAPSKSYKRHAWLAMAGLLSFVGLYLGLTGYLAWVVWRLLGNALLHNGNVVGAFFLSIPAMFFLAFLVRGLFVVKHGADPSLLEISPKEQPTLFAFLHKLADETGAPRPHKVFLSGRVNAGVFYDLSFWNLLLPSRKNLELGLGLVNALTLDELKAVIAHEFGHFAQRTMAVGRWVYLSQQIAGHIVMSRGIFDRFLTGLSRIDIRIAWIGWILRLFVWSIRAVLDTAFRIVVLAHRALGREMEFNADRVAVSVSGSDSLVHALHRLGPADEAWEEAVSFSAEELHAGRDVEDLFVLQRSALEHLRRIFDEPDFGKTPKRPEGDSTFRVFTAGLAQPPRMWLTHPPNRDREDSAKELYLPSPLDAREAWALFDDVETVRKTVTAKLFQNAKEEREKNSAGKPAAAVETTLEERFAKRFGRAALDPRYRGVYLGRSIAAYQEKADGLIGPVEALDHHGVLAALESLYPASLRTELKSYRERRDEEHQLEGLADGVLTAPGGVIRYRGREIRRKELRGVIEAVRTERRTVEQRILDHDRTCRATHLAAANLLGHGWNDHLQGLVELLHFVAHSLRNLSDAHSHLHHVLDIVLADGNVSSSERKRVLSSADDLYLVITRLWQAKQSLVLPDDIDALYGTAGGFTALSEELGLLEPNEGNLGDWLRVMEGWAQGALGDLRVLADVTLDRLLEVEAKVAAAVRDGVEVEDAPDAAEVPSQYGTCVVGKERERQKKLGWWDRFQTADGVVPGTVRAMVATGVLLPALFVGGHIGSSTLHVVNGLNVPVKVVIEEKAHVVPALSTDSWELEPSGDVQVKTTTLDGKLVEEFEVAVGGGFSHSVYNVASATALVEWTAVYGSSGNSELPDVPKGAPRWSDAPQEYIFKQPPTSVSLKRGQTLYKGVLEATFKSPPISQLALVSSPDEKRDLVLSHVRFDDVGSEAFGTWAGFAGDFPAVAKALLERADRSPSDVFLHRAVQDASSDEVRAARCATTMTAAEKAPADGDLQYLALRCTMADFPGYQAAWEAHPENPWLNWAVAEDLAGRGKWEESLKAFETAVSAKSFAPMKTFALVEYLRVIRGARAAGVQTEIPRVITTAPKESMVAFITRVEGAEQKDDWAFLKAYRALKQGSLVDALNLANGSPNVSASGKARMTLLVGASDGATERQREQAAKVTPTPDVQWVSDALRVRSDKKVVSAIGSVGSVPAGAAQEALGQALRDPGLATHPETLEAIAKSLPLRDRAVVLAMGLIVLGDKAPVSWRTGVKALLFTTERPHFR